MKRLLLILALLVSPITFTSCSLFRSDAPVTAEAKTFRTFQDTWTVTHAAYQAHCERVVTGKVTRENEVLADQLWNQFRTAFKIALTVAESNWKADPPQSVKVLSSELVAKLKPAQ